MPEAPVRPNPQERLLVALDPAPATRDRAAAVIARLAAEVADLGDGDVLDLIATAAEHPPGIRTVEAADRAGTTVRQLDYWTRQGYLRALPRVEEGSGRLLHYHPGEVVKARIMGSLTSLFGMAPASASEIAEQILVTGSAEVGGFKVTRKGLAS